MRKIVSLSKSCSSVFCAVSWYRQLEDWDNVIESVEVEVNASCASVRRVRTMLAYDLTLKISVPNPSAPNTGEILFLDFGATRRRLLVGQGGRKSNLWLL
jgi:hypothetical protein